MLQSRKLYYSQQSKYNKDQIIYNKNNNAKGKKNTETNLHFFSHSAFSSEENNLSLRILHSSLQDSNSSLTLQLRDAQSL